jgi:hypothetical protein
MTSCFFLTFLHPSDIPQRTNQQASILHFENRRSRPLYTVAPHRASIPTHFHLPRRHRPGPRDANDLKV